MNAPRYPLGRSWLTLTGALALHVADEAAHGFLSVYNPAVRALRETIPWLPLPTFSFGLWLTGLILAVMVLFVFTPVAVHGRRWIIVVAHVYAFLMLGNGTVHLAYSAYSHLAMPGVWSSPLLLVAAAWLWLEARCAWRESA
ncbi:MAG TPA: hypothetical protein VG936_01875 [Lacunisphaera sp.]|nr:hypothetical protein [Lacunisphaera sp.]